MALVCGHGSGPQGAEGLHVRAAPVLLWSSQAYERSASSWVCGWVCQDVDMGGDMSRHATCSSRSVIYPNSMYNRQVSRIPTCEQGAAAVHMGGCDGVVSHVSLAYP